MINQNDADCTISGLFVIMFLISVLQDGEKVGLWNRIQDNALNKVHKRVFRSHIIWKTSIPNTLL